MRRFRAELMLAAATLAISDPSLAGDFEVARDIGRALSSGISVGVGGLDAGVGIGRHGVDVDVGIGSGSTGRPPPSNPQKPALTPRQILGLGQNRITRAFNGLADSDQQKLKVRCAEVLADASEYDDALVGICQIIADIR
jgi:hypothetical protein